MTTPAKRLAERYRDHRLAEEGVMVATRVPEMIIEWLLAEQRKDRDLIAPGRLNMTPGERFWSLFDSGEKYGPPKPVTKDERIAKLRKAIQRAINDERVGRNAEVILHDAILEDDEDGGTP